MRIIIDAVSKKYGISEGCSDKKIILMIFKETLT